MIYVGDPLPLSVTVRDAAGALANAGNMALTITGPTTATVIDPVAPTSTGVYDYDFTPTEVGRHEYRWVATGANARTLEDVFNVDEELTGAIVSLSEAKAHLNIPDDDRTGDDELRQTIAVASEWVESRIGAVAQRTVTDVVTPSGGQLFLSQPVISLTSIAGAYGYGSTYDVGSVYLDDRVVNPGAYGAGFGCYPLTVTYVAGRAVVPEPVRFAVKELVRALWGSQRGPGDLGLMQGDVTAGGEGDPAQDSLGLAKWKAEQLLAPYMVPVVA